jgi:hypothetical protein
MKAKKVYEFQQGLDPYKAMGLGATPKLEDTIIILKDLYWNGADSGRNGEWINKKPKDSEGRIDKGDLGKIQYPLGEKEGLHFVVEDPNHNYIISWEWLKKYNGILYKKV